MTSSKNSIKASSWTNNSLLAIIVVMLGWIIVDNNDFKKEMREQVSKFSTELTNNAMMQIKLDSDQNTKINSNIKDIQGLKDNDKKQDVNIEKIKEKLGSI